MHRIATVLVIVLVAAAVAGPEARAQADRAAVKRAENRPLPSLHAAAQAARANAPAFTGRLHVVPNKPLGGESTRTQDAGPEPIPLLNQTTQGAGTTVVGASFDGASNDDNAAVVGFRIAPPDTDADVGEAYVVQMINLVTTIFDKQGNVVAPPFPSNAFWAGQGGLCEAFNQGDPIVLYDEAADRWLVSQFAFDDAFTTFAQCVAVSQTSDPTGGYNRYEFGFDDVGFNDYPKHGIVSESVTMMANIFRQRGPFFNYGGTYVGVMDKAAMYAGQAAALVGFNLGTNAFGYVAADLDDPAGTAGTVPALFATAMSNANQFDVWQLDVDWSNPGAASVSQVAALPISPYDADFCTASREECIPQPGTTQRLETLSDRLMHRLQIRDFGTYRTMVTGHAVDVGGGRAGIRWYELRETNGTWSLHQEGTYGPEDGLHRWMPSVAMNAAGDIGIGYLVSNSIDTYVSTAVAGQTAGQSGTGLLDAAEAVCAAGTGPQTGTGRVGDYSATAVDPVTDAFWHTNEYVGGSGGQFAWDTRICSFTLTPGDGGGTPPAAPSALAAAAVSSSQIDLTWSDNSGDETAFELERSLDGTTFGTVAVLGANTTSYSDTGLSASTTYTYQVRACSGAGCSAYSNTASATTQAGGGGATALYVASIVTGTENAGRGNKRGTATVTILDDQGGAVGGALVGGTFGGSYSESRSGTTGGDGTVTLTTNATAKGGVTVTFCVDSVTDDALTYDPNLNPSPSYDCGGSARSEALAGPAARQTTTPATFALEQNYPNPFNPVTRLAFTLPADAAVTLRVYNVLGQDVATLVDGYRAAGRHEVLFDAADLSAGVYLYTIETDRSVMTRRMTLLK